MESKVTSPDSGHDGNIRDRSVQNRYSGGGSTPGSGKRRGKSLKSFLKPGWVLSAVAIIVFSYAAFTMLAPWQLNKDEDITQRNEQIQEGYDRDLVPYSEVFSADGSVAPEEEWFRVSLTGHYLPENETLLRLRPVETTPAFQSLTPFQLDDGRIVLVNRGFMVSQGTIVPEIDKAPSSEVTIIGLARRNEILPDKQPLEDSGYQQVYGINTEQIGELTGLDLGEDYVQLLEDQPGEVTAMPIPQLDRGSHLSYGMQWIAFGVMAPLGLGYFIWAELKERRRDKAEREEMATQSEIPAAAETTTEREAEVATTEVTEPPVRAEKPQPDTPSISQQRRRSRYGDQHPDHYKHFSKRHEERF